MIKVLVTGKDSQLAKCLKAIEKEYSRISFVFKNSKDLNITDIKSVKSNFKKTEYDYCINCAAYTAVDKAETEPIIAKNINTIGVLNLVESCIENNVNLVHISTDFVFDGESKRPYLETDSKNPLGVYGKTKSEAEDNIIEYLETYFIIRTSWLYSQYNQNFFKSMLDLAQNSNEIRIVKDQIGCPTNANDLAHFICKIIDSGSKTFGVYHFCNKGEASRHSFAEEIFRKWDIKVAIKPIKTSEYPTAAKRPKYSVLDTSKTERIFNFKINSWKDALHNFNLTQNKE
ncbi:dTDP-4-dehydrorhamnose reductase [Winogradskyella sp. PC-19]|uniref:dTDP-4-dehydrorhamnose reductase n=1 Tax=Winogradskyella sp. PC-19 TaxID=754417 RepID=UPI000B3C958F|nr:dTDP-4-dehydrorhamnose reductase [Winogradskyella sp. PC-19]ARV09702.1 dTDP-4-dehydrorhamnose reductase [Winogradskyella sp. PC-19]